MLVALPFAYRPPIRSSLYISTRRPPIRSSLPSPSLPPVALPSARRPPFRPSRVAHPSARRSPFRPLPFVSSPFLSLVPLQSPSSSLPVALAIPLVSLPIARTCHPSLLPHIPLSASSHPLPCFPPSPSLLPPIPFPASPHPLPCFHPSPSLLPHIPFPASTYRLQPDEASTPARLRASYRIYAPRHPAGSTHLHFLPRPHPAFTLCLSTSYSTDHYPCARSTIPVHGRAGEGPGGWEREWSGE
ncbi:unnamed protein product [Closterium sp. NIES-65]|nr:unnamed protein product [Closterium sp. NIES-65]